MIYYEPLRAVCWHLLKREIECGKWVGENGKHFTLHECVVCRKLIKGEST